MTTEKRSIQRYEVRLRKAGVLRLADVGGFTRISCADTAAAVGHALMKNVPHEQVWIVMMNGSNDLQGCVRVGEGGMHGCALRPSDILRPVLLAGASGYVVIHNHPSGDPTPSGADVELTRVLAEASELVGVYLLDHVIVTRDPNVWRSLKERGEC